jgi:hypothetical protein
MQLDSSTTINLASGEQLVLDNLDVVIFDHQSRKLALAKVHPSANLLPLWRGPDYDTIGDYTQAQVEDRIKELLGPNLEQLQGLFNREVI